MKVSGKCIELIKRHEGFRARAYKCPAGVWTIGYGTTAGVAEGMVCTETQATQKLINHLASVERDLNNLNLPINQNQFDALADFIYNLGFVAFRNSFLLKTIRINPNNPAIRDEFGKWIHGGGKVLPGLVRRRNDDANLYFSL